MSDRVVYALVKVSKDRWLVARQSAVIEGEYRYATKPLHESLARRVYDELRILGEDRASSQVKELLV